MKNGSKKRDYTILFGFFFLFLLLSLMALPFCDAKMDDNAFVKAHNKVRAEADSKQPLKPLRWNETVAEHARRFVETLKNSSKCPNGHSASADFGENMFWSSANPNSLTSWQVVQTWADQKRFYNYVNNTCSAGGQCGVYTQIVWNATSELGCASVRCLRSAFTIVVCNY